MPVSLFYTVGIIGNPMFIKKTSQLFTELVSQQLGDKLHELNFLRDI